MGNSKSGKSQSSTSNGNSGSKKTGAFQVSNDPVVHGKMEENVHKYEAAPAPEPEPQRPATPPAPKPAYEELGQLPETYGINSVFLIARDPQWLFSYWDIDWNSYPANAAKKGGKKIFLKVFFEGGGEQSTIEINPEAKNWYIPVPQPGTSYYVEIGYYGAGEKWVSIAHSVSATTPADKLASDEFAHFATLPFHITFQRLVDLVKSAMSDGESLVSALSRLQGEGRKLAFAPGVAPSWTNEQREVLIALLGSELVDRVGMGSAEIDQILRQELQRKLSTESASELVAKGLWGPGVSSLSSGFAGFGVESTSLFSGIGASWSTQPHGKPREFFMHVNAEVIFYGGTHPDAEVTIDGKKIALNPDGTFRFHFKFPDGEYDIPIVATSPDKVETRTATLSFRRATARKGDVGHTAQPKELPKKPMGKKKK